MIARKIAIGASAAVLAAAGGIAVSQGSDSPVASATTAQPGGMPAGPGGDRGLSGLATSLGVSERRLASAMRSARPDPGSATGPQDMAATLAKALNLSTAKVQKALEASRPSGAPAPPGQG